MIIFASISFLSFCIALCLGIVVYTKNPSSRLNRVFLWLCILEANWAFSEFHCRVATSSEGASWWLKLGALWPFAIAALFHFAIIFSNRSEFFVSKLLKNLIYLSALFIFILYSATSLIGGDPIETYWGWTYSRMPNMWISNVVSTWGLAVSLFALAICLNYFLTLQTQRQRWQAKMVVIGFSIPILVGLITEGVFPFLDIRIPEMIATSLIIANLFIGYAICKHEMFIVSPASMAEGIVSTMSDFLFLTDPDNRIQLANRAALKALGYEEHELQGRSITTLISEIDSNTDLTESINKKLKHRDYTSVIETYLESKEGEKVAVSLAVSSMKSKAGESRGIIYAFRDIRKRKLIEDELNKKTQRLETILKSSDDIIFQLSPSGQIQYVSPAVKNLYGYDPEDFIGASLEKTTPSDELPKAIEVVKDVLSGKTVRYFNINQLDKEGKIVSMEVNLTPVEKEGKIIAIQGVMRDITERNCMEAEARESELKFTTIFNNATVGILLMDVESKKIYDGNEAICQMLDYSIVELKELSIRDIHPAQDLPHVIEQFEKQNRKEITLAIDIPVKRKDGSCFIADISSSPISIAGIVYLLGLFRDITKRRQAEERFRLAAEVASDLIYEWDLTDDSLEWYGDIAGILGYEPGESPKTIKSWVQHIHPDDIERLADAVKLHRTSTEPIEYEYQVRKKDGSWLIWSDHGKPVVGTDGLPTKWIGVCTDITERKRVEEALRKSEAKYRMLVENMNEGFGIVDKQGIFTFVNEKKCQMIGYSSEEIIGRPLIDFLDRKNRELALDQFAARKKGETDSYELSWTHKNGSKIPVLISPRSLYDEEGRFIGSFATETDLSQIRRIEEKIGLLENAIESAQIGVTITDANGKILYINQSESQMHGYTIEELFAKDVGILAPAGTRKRMSIEKIQKLQRWSRESINVHKDGSQFPVYLNSSILLDKDGELSGMLTTCENITGRKREEDARKNAEMELEKQRAIAIRADRLQSLGEMAAGIAHELQQPLVGVRAFAEYLLIGFERNWDLTDEKIKGKITGIIEQSDRMTHIIQHVRMFAKGARRPETLPVKVNEVVKIAVDLMTAQFQSRGLELECQLGQDIPFIMANPFSLEEVILNLLTNARDATELKLEDESFAGSPQVIIRTRSETKNDKSQVIIEVEDQGTGIAEDILPKVFDPFFTTKDPDKGTGLGLPISNSIVKEFKGTMEIQSSPNIRTLVTVSFPACEVESE
jgi:PAS domain S-box-containing protein